MHHRTDCSSSSRMLASPQEICRHRSRPQWWSGSRCSRRQGWDSWNVELGQRGAAGGGCPSAGVQGRRASVAASSSRSGAVVESRGNAAAADVVPWTSKLIWRHSEEDSSSRALVTYEAIHAAGGEPTSYKFVAALKACCRMRDLERIRAVHGEAIRCGLDGDVYVGTVLVDTYAKCGSLADARSVFESMPVRNVVSWTAMILGYAQQGEEEGGEVAVGLFRRMQREGVVEPNSRTFVAALKAYSSLLGAWKQEEGEQEGVEEQGRWSSSSRKKAQQQQVGEIVEEVKGVHAEVVRRGFASDVYVGTMLVDVYAKCGRLEDARRVFEEMPHRNVVSWTAMIFGYAQMERGEEALELYACMQRDGVAPNDHTFVGVLKACAALASGSDEGVVAHSSGGGWSGSGSGSSYGEEEDAAAAGDVKKKKNWCLEQVRAIHRQVVHQRGSETGLFIGNTLVDAYAKCGSLEDARQVFEAMPRRDVVSWTAMILGYAQTDSQADEALQLYARMQQEGVAPNHRTHIGALKACGSVAALDKGQAIHAALLLLAPSSSSSTASFVASSLIDMYGKCGSMSDAQQVFDAACVSSSSSSRRCTVTWSALIAGYARQGQSSLAFHWFDRMTAAGVPPNGVTFLALLTACSHAGLVEQARHYWAAMTARFGVRPRVEHFTCLIDLLGRAGAVDEAVAVATSMPVRADGAVWRAVLGACEKWGRVDLAQEAFDRAVKQRAGGYGGQGGSGGGGGGQSSAEYVLMANVYAAARMWADARAVRETRVGVEAWKQPGRSAWTDADGGVHEFMVMGARWEQHPDDDRLRVKLGDMGVRVAEELGEGGLVASLNYSPWAAPLEGCDEAADGVDGKQVPLLCGYSDTLASAIGRLSRR